MQSGKKQKKIRVFISINLPVSVQNELQRLIEKLQKFHWPVKREKTDTIHLTLAFLGWTKTPLSKIKEAVENACSETIPFEINTKGLGAFPDFIKPRIVWLGLKGDLKSLAQIQKNIAKELEKREIFFNKTPFVAHMTIGRVKKGISQGALRDLGKKISQMRKIDFQNRILVDSIDVMKSQLQRTGSVYTKLVGIKL